MVTLINSKGFVKPIPDEPGLISNQTLLDSALPWHSKGAEPFVPWSTGPAMMMSESMSDLNVDTSLCKRSSSSQSLRLLNSQSRWQTGLSARFQSAFLKGACSTAHHMEAGTMSILCGSSLELLRGQCMAVLLSRSGKSVLQCKMLYQPGGQIALSRTRGPLRLVNGVRLKNLAAGRDMESATVHVFGRSAEGSLLKFRVTPDRLLEPSYEISTWDTGVAHDSEEWLHFDGKWLRSFSAVGARGPGISATHWKVQQWDTRSGIEMQPVSLSGGSDLPAKSKHVAISKAQGQELCAATASLRLLVLNPEDGQSEPWGHHSSHRVSI